MHHINKNSGILIILMNAISSEYISKSKGVCVGGGGVHVARPELKPRTFLIPCQLD